MNLLGEIKSRFASALGQLVDDPTDLLEMIRPTQDPKFGDYQANCAMPLKNQLGKPPREIAESIIAKLEIDDLCEPPEIAGPGFINLRIRDDWISAQIALAAQDERTGVALVGDPKTVVIDYSSPNVAKPMHVGHIRSTVIGDALYRVFKFLGHNTISDNHLGDWGTQFGMIIYGFKHFAKEAQFDEQPIEELTRIYRLVNRLIEYHKIKSGKLDELQSQLDATEQEIASAENREPSGDKGKDKKAAKQLSSLKGKRNQLLSELDACRTKLEAVESDVELSVIAEVHTDVGDAVLEETAKLHAGDEENNKLWNRFLPFCQQEIQTIYDRMNIRFDYAYGESFYHPHLGAVVEEFKAKGLAQESDGAQCVFLDGFKAPMIIQKKDGAFLYATSDLATIRFRAETWKPDLVLYVVDQRQAEHFGKLFAAAKTWGYDSVRLEHVAFGTVLGKDGKPIKTRDGDLVQLNRLLDEAVAEAYKIVDQVSNDLHEGEKREIALMVGHGATKYNDLSHNRTSDYKFDLEKMVQLNGDTATYVQYSYARCCGIFARAGVERESVRSAPLVIEKPIERALALELVRFQSALEDVTVDFRPNLLTAYLYKLADTYAKFFESCPVLKADTNEQRDSRLMLCDLTARVLKTGLNLLGIEVRDRM